MARKLIKECLLLHLFHYHDKNMDYLAIDLPEVARTFISNGVGIHFIQELANLLAIALEQR